MWPTKLKKDAIFPNPKCYSGIEPIAYGGSLNLTSLITAYSFGMFPWYNEGEPILWWCPTPRYILKPSEVKVSRSMRPYLNGKYQVSINSCFEDVIENCSCITRPGQNGTWITEEMKLAYIGLHKEKIAHSIEVWEDANLVGGLYGVSLGKIFCGESMFSLKSNASKFALIKLAALLGKNNFVFIDFQIKNDHLESMGGKYINPDLYFSLLERNRRTEPIIDTIWQ